MYIHNDLGQILCNLIESYVNGALFRGRIFCRLYLNASLEFPALCSAQCHVSK